MSNGLSEPNSRELPEFAGELAKDYQAACEGVAVFHWSRRAKVELGGPDARMFLHNLCTNDIKNLKPGTGCEAFLTTAKARVVAHFLVNCRQFEGREFFLLDSVPGTAEKILQHLDHFLISEQVEMADRTAEYGFLHLAGPRAQETLEKTLNQAVSGLALLQQVEGNLENTPFLVRRHEPLGLPGFDLILPASALETTWHRLLDQGARSAGFQTWEALRVEAGTPVLGRDFNEERLVMEVGRTKQAICYTKGCFLGQEPIVMARDRGQLNRLLLGVKLANGILPAPGARLFHQGNEVGQITTAVHSPRLGLTIALAYLRRGTQEPETILQIENSGDQAQVCSLPFLSS